MASIPSVADAAAAAEFQGTIRPASRFARLPRSCWSKFKERRERARVRAILYAMQDRELRDIGITRDEIESVLVDDTGERIRAYPKAKALRRSTRG
jgi:uncharacterized protein YjiS (DUF1127 family)